MKKELDYLSRNIKYILPGKWKAGATAAYRRMTKTGVFLSKSEIGMCSLNPIKMVDTIVDLVKPRSILDVGCGTGKTTAYLHQRGLEALGV